MMIGKIITAALDIDLKPSIFIIEVIIMNISITISTSIFGKYMSTKLSAKILITKAETVKRYTIRAIVYIFLATFPPTYSQISIKSEFGNNLKNFVKIQD